VSGKKRITVDEDAWRETMRKANRLRDVERELPGMIAAVKQAQEQQAARDRAAMQERQDQLTKQIANLSEQARKIEASATRRINAATATIMNEAREANQQLRVETRQLLDQQEKQFDAALSAEGDERRRETEALRGETAALRSETGALRSEIARDRAARASVLDTAQTAVADARVLHDAIGSSLPHERFTPGKLARLTERLAIAEANVAAGTGETALGQAQELYVSLGELRAEVELKDAEWRAGHLTAVAAVTALAEQIRYNSMIMVTDEESGASAELDVDFWSNGELSTIKKDADELTARVNAEADPPTLAELRDISERAVVTLNERLSEVVAAARTRQWASQVRVNLAEMVVDVLESTTGYFWNGDATFAGDDQREAFYSKLKHVDESEIVIEVAPDEDGKSCVIRVMSYETGNPDESQRVARVHAIADSLREQGLSGTAAAENDEPDLALKDFTRLQRRQATHTVPERA
jgi:hypothetical protein